MYQINDVKAVIAKVAAAIHAQKDYLGELDGKSGDGDLGLSMEAAFHAVQETADTYEGTQISELLMKSAMSCNKAAPSTMGTLMASGLMNVGKVYKGCEELDDVGFFQAYFDGVQNRGKAALGDKTFLDGLAPAIETLRSAQTEGKAEYAKLAADSAWQAFENTRGMLAKHGRMAIRGEQSREMLDPGAAVAALLMKGYAQFKADSE